MRTHYEALDGISQAHKKQICMWNKVTWGQTMALYLSVGINRIEGGKKQ